MVVMHSTSQPETSKFETLRARLYVYIYIYTYTYVYVYIYIGIYYNMVCI